MNRSTVTLTAVLIICAVALGCSSRGESPVALTTAPGATISDPTTHGQRNSQTHLWGFYDIYIDVENQTCEAVPNRDVMFAANVVNFLNKPPTNLSFSINGTPVDPGGKWLDVDIDVTTTHPFPGFREYNGYDVRGVFIANGSDTLTYNLDLVRAVKDTDQFMRDYNETGDPDVCGNPDGYTRWWNPDEFKTPGMFGYTEGAYATPGYTGSATLNPYKYFADGLGSCDDLWGFLTTTGMHGVFSAGSSNTRNYYLRFPTPSPHVVYNYAVVANWIDLTTHPTNAVEAVGCNVAVTPDIYYDSPIDWGGHLLLDIDLFGWQHEPSTVYVESSVLNAVHTVPVTMWHPIGDGYTFSTLHVDIPAEKVSGSGWTEEFWVIVDYEAFDYTNEFGVPNLAGTDPLAALFRYDLYIADEPYCENLVPIVNTLNSETSYLAVTRAYTGWTIEGDQFEGSDMGVAVNDGASDIAFATNVQWIDTNNITFDIDLSAVPVGTYDIVVLNGCGERKRGVGADMLTVLRHIYVVDDPNIDVVTGFDAAKDIAIDPSSDQVGISYTHYWVKWTDDYATSSSRHDSWLNWATGSPVAMGYWDAQVALIWYCHDAGPWHPGYDACWSWTDWTGWQSTRSQWQSETGNEMTDVANLQGTDYIWGLYDWAGHQTSGNPDPLASFIRTNADYRISYPGHARAPFYGGSGSTGVVLENVRAIDFPEYSGVGNPNIHILEYLPSSNTGVVETWTVGYTPAFVSSFGEDFLYDTLDITVDEDYNVYVLETDSEGDPMIWAYDPAGQLIGWSEPLSATDLSGDPLRIDCHLSKDPDEVHALHTDGVTRFGM